MLRRRSPKRLVSYPAGWVVGAVEMILERGHRSLRITCLDRVDDPLVLAHDLLEDLGRPLGAEGCDPDETAELSEHSSQDRELGAVGDPKVKALVQVEEILAPSRPRRAKLLHQVEPELIEIVDLHHLAGAPDRHGLERPTEVLDLAPVLRREVAHAPLPTRAELDEALLEQPAERFAYRRA